MKSYAQIQFADGTSCTCEAKDVPELTADTAGFTLSEIQMTEAEFEALPDC